jgi:hypothetical protein
MSYIEQLAAGAGRRRLEGEFLDAVGVVAECRHV